MNLSNRVKQHIKDIVEKKHLSIYELSNKADLTEACIRNWYTKRNYTPSLKAIEKISEALNVPITEIIKEDDAEMMALDKEQKQLLEKWMLLGDKQKKLIQLQIEAFLDK